MSTAAFAKESVQDFNHLLIKDVQRDIQNQNDDQFKTKESRTRGPASVGVEVEARDIKDYNEDKIEKNFKQLGSRKW